MKHQIVAIVLLIVGSAAASSLIAMRVETEAVAARVIALPTGTTVDVSAVEIICSVIRCAIENAAMLEN